MKRGDHRDLSGQASLWYVGNTGALLVPTDHCRGLSGGFQQRVPELAQEGLLAFLLGCFGTYYLDQVHEPLRHHQAELKVERLYKIRPQCLLSTTTWLSREILLES